jgi:hypothetical protein
VDGKDELDDLIMAFDRLVHAGHPNPERIGCPGPASLAKLATKPEGFGTAPILDHVRECAPCLDELRDLRQSIKREQQ